MVNNRKCLVDSCSRPHYGLGYCCAHYRRTIAHGNPMSHIPIRNMVNPKLPFIDRFMRFVITGDSDDSCWGWSGEKTIGGYGRMVRDKKRVAAHRASFEIFNGAIPDGLCVCHSCDNRECCNPKHLWLGTHADNSQDMKSKGRGSCMRGERNPTHKLTDECVRSIRAKRTLGATLTTIANEFGIADSTVHRIVSRKRWPHVE